MSQKNALLSVFDKTGIVEFACELTRLGYTIIASGGTASTLSAANKAVEEQLKPFKEKERRSELFTEKEQAQRAALNAQLIDLMRVESLTGLPPVLGHRVVTLHPKIHGGLMATEAMETELVETVMGRRIHLLCVDLYPLEAEIAKSDSTRESVIEKTDIGGPALLRSAAKGGRVVIADAADRQMVLDWLKAGCPNKDEMLQHLRAKAEFVASRYALASACYHGQGEFDGAIGVRHTKLTYGENPWQSPAAYYGVGSTDPLAPERFARVAGKDPSFVGFIDVFDRLLQTVTHIDAGYRANADLLGCAPDPFIAVGVKHGNACGAAVSEHSGVEAIEKMIDGDPLAIHGGVVMLTFPVGEAEVEALISYGIPEGQRRRILDGVVAPAFAEGVTSLLERKDAKCRLYANPALDNKKHVLLLDTTPRRRTVRGGGWVRQPNYTFVLDLDHPELDIAGPALTLQKKKDLILASAVGCTSNSNTTTVAKDGQILGNGVNQQDRVGSGELALWRARRAKYDSRGAIGYTDSFYPFPDGPQVLVDAGVDVLFASAGGKNFDQIVEVCMRAGVTLVTLPDATCRGFFGH